MPIHTILTKSRMGLQPVSLGFIAIWLLFMSAFAAAAGRVELIEGSVTAETRDGKVRVLAKGDRVVAGEVITTERMSEVHLLMDDNAVMALRANTRMRIESYLAEGNKDRDNGSVALLQGAMRTVTGWITRLNPDKFTLKSRNATVGVRGTDFEAVDVEEATDGAERGVYVRVTDGETVVKTAAGEVNVPAGLAAFAPLSASAPRRLTVIPPVFKPTPNEARIESLKKEAAESLTQRLAERQRAARLPACDGESAPARVLEEFIRAFEMGNLALIRERVDPMMPGYQRFMDEVQQDINNLKQLRLFIKDVNVQCGPDLTVISFTWEKRYLELLTFDPRLVTGRGQILFHRAADNWRIAAVSGANPFASRLGSLARIVFGPTLDISTLDAGTAQPGSPQARAASPADINLTMEVSDADLATRTSIIVELTTASGDRETVNLPAVRPGVFRRDRQRASTNPPIPGNGILELRVSEVVTLRYADPQPGGDRPPATLTQTVTVSGMPIVVDTTPDPFAYTNVVGIAPNLGIESAAIVVSGINRPAPISVVGGQYRIDGAALSSAPATIRSGQRVSLFVVSAAEPMASRTATLNIGGVTGSFTVTTAAQVINTPEPFTFIPVTGAMPSSLVVSNEIVVRGVTVAIPASIANGEYSVNGGAFTAIAGSVRANDRIRVRIVASATPGGSASTTLLLGGLAGTFTVTTAIPTELEPFSFSPVTGATANSNVASNRITVNGLASGATATISVSGGAYSINSGGFTTGVGNVRNGDTVTVNVVASAAPGGTASATLVIGSRSATFVVTTAGSVLVPDTTPDPFSFAPVVGALPGTSVTSSGALITGINQFTPISVVGGEYSINGSAFTAAPSQVVAGSTITLRTNASMQLGGVVTVVLTVGGVNGNWTVQTVTPDSVPDPFSFSPASGLAPRATAVSNVVTIAGINVPATVTVNGGEASVNGGAFSSTPPAIANGQTLQLRGIAPAMLNASSMVTVTVGGVAATFTLSTAAIDTTPNPFTFNPQNSVALRTIITSNPVTVGGINSPAPISIVGGTYSINGGAPTSAAGTIDQGQTVTVQLESSAMFATGTSATLTIGGVSATFTVTTLVLDTTPDAFAFVPQNNVALGARVTSNSITVAGINSAAPISVVGGTYAIGAGAPTSAAGTVTVGQTVTLQAVASGMFSTPVAVTLTIGGVSATFTVTTGAIDTTPDPFTFIPQNNVAFATRITSNAVMVSGVNSAAPISIVGGTYAINGGLQTTAAGTVMAGDSVTVVVVSATIPLTPAAATLTIGGVSSTFTVTTAAADTTPDPFTFAPGTCAGPGIPLTSGPVTITGLNTASPVTVTGGEHVIGTNPPSSAPGTILNGQNLQARVTCPVTPGTASVTVTVGGVAATFTATLPVDTTPDPYVFTPQSCTPGGFGPMFDVPSNVVTITGINAAAPTSVVGGNYRLNGGTQTTAAGTLTNGQTLQAYVTCPATPGNSASVTTTVGGVSATFTVTYPIDTTPNPFTIPNTATCPLLAHTASAAVTITGINSPASVSFSASGLNNVMFPTQISIAGGPFTTAPGTISNGQTIQLRAAGYGTVAGAQVRATVTIGGVTATWTTFC
jgi:hypothetical protein